MGFWVIIIVVLGLITAVNQPDNNDDTSVTTSTETPNNEPKTSENTDKNDATPEASSTTNASPNQAEGTSSLENSGGYKVGETMVFKDRKVTVTNVERNYSTGNDLVTPEDGKASGAE